MELLISITMLALIAGIMGWTLNAAHRTLDKGEKKINYLEREKISFSLIESQILSLFRYQYENDGQKKLFFSGSKDKLMFTSNFSLWRGARGNTFVTYEIESNEGDKSFLKITEQIIGLQEKSETILLNECNNISFEYFLKNAIDEGEWVTSWPEDQKELPDKIKVSIARGAKKFALILRPPVGEKKI